MTVPTEAFFHIFRAGWVAAGGNPDSREFQTACIQAHSSWILYTESKSDYKEYEKNFPKSDPRD